MKIRQLQISGFKCFADIALALGDITLLSGLNSSGKSSIIQALRMFNDGLRGESPFLEGYGDFEELRSRFSLPGTPIKIRCEYDNGKGSELTIDSADTFSRPSLAPITYHLSAARHGPQASLPLSRASQPWPALGSKGDYVVDFLTFFEGAIVSELLERDKSSGVTVELQLTSWLQEIAPGSSIILNKDVKRDSSYYEINSFRPANAGFGVSYSLPIIAALLGLTSNPSGGKWATARGQAWENSRSELGVLLLIENPEAHLHPRAQTYLGRLLAMASNCGIQIIVETQSDYILDGIRIAVKEKLIPPGSTQVYYLKSENDSVPEVVAPQIYADGRLAFWPEGFFDQTLKNKMDLAG